MIEADCHRIAPRAEIIENNRSELVVAEVLKAIRTDARPPEEALAIIRGRSREYLVALAATCIAEAVRIDKAKDGSRPHEDR